MMVSDKTRNKGMVAFNGVTTLPSTRSYRKSQDIRTKYIHEVSYLVFFCGDCIKIVYIVLNRKLPDFAFPMSNIKPLYLF